MTERKAHQVVALALEGRALGDRQRHYLAWLLDQADELAAGAPPERDQGGGGEVGL